MHWKCSEDLIFVDNKLPAKQVDVLPSKNQALSEYCTHFK